MKWNDYAAALLFGVICCLVSLALIELGWAVLYEGHLAAAPRLAGWPTWTAAAVGSVAAAIVLLVEWACAHVE